MPLVDQTAAEVLPDVLTEGLDLVFCGTAPSKVSAVAGAYYANPRNRFWKILHECGFTEYQLEPHEFSSLKERRIGLTDLCKFISGSDDRLPSEAFLPSRLSEAIEKYQPRFLAFTSGNAGQKYFGRTAKYGPQTLIGSKKTYILPTTSPRRGSEWWDKNKIYWHKFSEEFHSSVK